MLKVKRKIVISIFRGFIPILRKLNRINTQNYELVTNSKIKNGNIFIIFLKSVDNIQKCVSIACKAWLGQSKRNSFLAFLVINSNNAKKFLKNFFISLKNIIMHFA